MFNHFKLKLAIEQIYNKYLDKETIDYNETCNIDGESVYISFHKWTRYIDITAQKDETIHHYSYPAPYGVFDMNKLQHLYSTNKDD